MPSQPNQNENEGGRKLDDIVNNTGPLKCISDGLGHAPSVPTNDVQVKRRNKIPPKSEASEIEKQMTRMFFAVTLSFFIFLLPMAVRAVVFPLYKQRTQKEQAILQLFMVCSRCLYAAMFSLNFYLYVVFSKKFRKNLVQLFRK